MPKKNATDGEPLKRKASLFARVKKGLQPKSRDSSPKVGRKAKPSLSDDSEDVDSPDAVWIAGDVPDFDDLNMNASDMDQLQQISDDKLNETIEASVINSIQPGSPTIDDARDDMRLPIVASTVVALDEEDNWEEDVDANATADNNNHHTNTHNNSSNQGGDDVSDYEDVEDNSPAPMLASDSEDEGPPPPLPPRPSIPEVLGQTSDVWDYEDDVTPFTYLSVMEHFAVSH